MDIPNKTNIQSIENALYIEHKVQQIITQQELNGVYFNKRKAYFYLHVLREHQIRLYKKIRPHLKLVLSVPYNQPVSKPFLKSGEYSLSVKKWYNNKTIPDIGGPFTRVEHHEPDIGKRKQILSQLLRLGWKPAHYTEKGNPKITYEGEPCKSLFKIDNSIGRDLADWYTYRHRQGQIEGLTKIVRRDGRISAEAITIGTPTFRFRHKGVVNIPRVSSIFGRQMRSLFGVKDKINRRFVGYDASGLELRMLANYINDNEFTKTVTQGRQEDGTDIHTRNQKDAGLPDRDTSKTFIYAFIYGARDGKIGSIAGTNKAGGSRIRNRFLKRNPRLKELIETTERAAKRGYLTGLDGRKLHIRKDKFTGKPQINKALNTLLQGGGATVMKWAMVYLDTWIKQYNLDSKKVIDMHDEGQQDTSKQHAHDVGRLAVMSIQQAGRILNLNVPLDAEYKVGLNWAQTH